MKRIVRVAAVVLALVSVSLLLLGCNKNSVEGVEIVKGSLKSVYSLDEELDISSGRLRVSYKNGDVVDVEITRAMFMNEFNSAMPGEKELRFKYVGQIAVFQYEVKSDIEIDSPFRLLLEASKAQNSVAVKAKNIELIDGGVYAVSFELNLVGIEFASLNRYVSNDYEMVYERTDNVVKVVMYSKNGRTPFTADGTICVLNYTKRITESEFGVKLENLRISDGNKDYVKMPKKEVGL